MSGWAGPFRGEGRDVATGSKVGYIGLKVSFLLSLLIYYYRIPHFCMRHHRLT